MSAYAISLQPWVLLSHSSPEIIYLNPFLRRFYTCIYLVHVCLNFVNTLFESLWVDGVEPKHACRNTVHLFSLLTHIDNP